MPAGYSATPLPKKLGIREGTRLLVIDAPGDYADLLGDLPGNVSRVRKASDDTDLAHVFVTERSVLVKHLAALRRQLRPDAAIWVSWPKKASRVPSEVTEDTIREVALPLGFVDIKVCAVSAVWSGLKLTLRKTLRSSGVD